MKEKEKLANMYYDFVCEFNNTKKDKNDNNEQASSKLQKKIKNIINEMYMNDTMYFVLKKDRDVSIKEIMELLSTDSGTCNLINKLEITFDDENNYISQIENLDYITKNIVNLKELAMIVKRNFEYDDDFNKFDYFSLYLKYKELDKKLLSYHKQFE